MKAIVIFLVIGLAVALPKADPKAKAQSGSKEEHGGRPIVGNSPVPQPERLSVFGRDSSNNANNEFKLTSSGPLTINDRENLPLFSNGRNSIGNNLDFNFGQGQPQPILVVPYTLQDGTIAYYPVPINGGNQGIFNDPRFNTNGGFGVNLNGGFGIDPNTVLGFNPNGALGFNPNTGLGVNPNTFGTGNSFLIPNQFGNQNRFFNPNGFDNQNGLFNQRNQFDRRNRFGPNRFANTNTFGTNNNDLINRNRFDNGLDDNNIRFNFDQRRPRDRFNRNRNFS